MKISVIIPVYNVSQYIERCLLSVANQTYSDIECILVDDCGNDDSVVKCKSFISEYKGNVCFSIVHHDQNRGLSAARNTGLLTATGEYVYFLDSDDELPSNAIQILFQKMSEFPEIDMVQGCTVSFPSDSYYDIACFRDHAYTNDNSWMRHNFYHIEPSNISCKILPVNGWNKLIKRDFLINNRLFFLEGIIHEDEHWMWFVVKYIHSMAFVFVPTYYHYITPNSIMTSLTEAKHAVAFGKILQDWAKNVDEVSSSEQLYKILVLYRTLKICNYYTNGERQFRFNILKSMWNYKHYKAFVYMFLWNIVCVYKDSTKLYRYAYESLI